MSKFPEIVRNFANHVKEGLKALEADIEKLAHSEDAPVVNVVDARSTPATPANTPGVPPQEQLPIFAKHVARGTLVTLPHAPQLPAQPVDNIGDNVLVLPVPAQA
jgi:hypothetical protein